MILQSVTVTACRKMNFTLTIDWVVIYLLKVIAKNSNECMSLGLHSVGWACLRKNWKNYAIPQQITIMAPKINAERTSMRHLMSVQHPYGRWVSVIFYISNGWMLLKSPIVSEFIVQNSSQEQIIFSYETFFPKPMNILVALHSLL